MSLHQHRSLRVCEIEILDILARDRQAGEAPADKDRLRDMYIQYLMICRRLAVQPSTDLSKSVLDRLHFDEFRNREYADWKRVRTAIEHENTVVNHRLTWFFTIQLVLVAAVGAIMKDLRAAGRTDLGLIIGLLIASVIGFVLCLAIYTIIKDAHDQIDQLDRWWYRKWEPSIPESSAEYSDDRNKAIKKVLIYTPLSKARALEEVNIDHLVGTLCFGPFDILP